MRNVTYPLFVTLFFLVLLFTCNVMNKQQSEQQKWLHEQAQLGKGYRWLYQDSLLGVRALAKLVEGELFFEKMSIFLQDSVRYTNTTTLFTTQFDFLPIVQHLPNNQHEVLMGIVDTNQNYQILQIKLSPQLPTILDTLPFFDGQNTDIDKDGKVEFKGYLAADEPYCAECDSVYYNPLLFYEQGETGFCLDSALTRQWCQQHYGGFKGFYPNRKWIVPLKTRGNLVW